MSKISWTAIHFLYDTKKRKEQVVNLISDTQTCKSQISETATVPTTFRHDSSSPNLSARGELQRKHWSSLICTQRVICFSGAFDGDSDGGRKESQRQESFTMVRSQNNCSSLTPLHSTTQQRANDGDGCVFPESNLVLQKLQTLRLTIIIYLPN